MAIHWWILKTLTIEENTTIYAALENAAGQSSDAVVYNVENIDKEAPTVSGITATNVTEDSITVQVNATDTGSGIQSYKYYLDGAEAGTPTGNSCTFSGLSSGTPYTIKVEVSDKVGNMQTDTIKIMTHSPVGEILREGDYVFYENKDGQISKYIVLYGPENSNYNKYGIQIISEDIVENLEFIGDDVENRITQYNEIITTLNQKSNNYLNPAYASKSRSVGTVPDNPSYDEASMFTLNSSWFSKYNKRLKNSDSNYLEDYNQMESIGIRAINKRYLLGSRYAGSGDLGCSFSVRYITEDGAWNTGRIITFWKDGGNDYDEFIMGLRVVITLKPEIKVVGGEGIEGSPYVLSE